MLQYPGELEPQATSLASDEVHDSNDAMRVIALESQGGTSATITPPSASSTSSLEASTFAASRGDVNLL
jgi:hypothetical protein